MIGKLYLALIRRDLITLVCYDELNVPRRYRAKLALYLRGTYHRSFLVAENVWLVMRLCSRYDSSSSPIKFRQVIHSMA